MYFNIYLKPKIIIKETVRAVELYYLALKMDLSFFLIDIIIDPVTPKIWMIDTL
jgi:hypothetical protein